MVDNAANRGSNRTDHKSDARGDGGGHPVFSRLLL